MRSGFIVSHSLAGIGNRSVRFYENQVILGSLQAAEGLIIIFITAKMIGDFFV